MVTKNSSFPFSDVLLLLFGNCYFLTTVLFVGDLLLTLAVVVAFPSSSIVIPSKTLESVIAFVGGMLQSHVFLCIKSLFCTRLLWIFDWLALISIA